MSQSDGFAPLSWWGRSPSGAPDSLVQLSADDIAALYRRHARVMLSFFARRTYDPETAVDLVAETFADAIADRRQFRGETHEQAAAWLFGIARHQLSAWYRRGEVERKAMDRLAIERRDLTEDEHDRIVELSELEQRRARVREHLGQLPAKIRQPIAMRVVEERSYAHIADALTISEQAARARVSRGLRALARALEDDDELKELTG